MGNIIQYLKDPALVRRVQEAFSVNQITIEVKESDSKVGVCSSSCSSDESAEESQTEGWSSGRENKEEKDVEIQRNSSSSSLQGSLKWLSSKTRLRRQIHTPPPHSSSCLSYDSDNAASTLEDKRDDVLEVLVVETNSFINIYFRLATEAGYEPFFIIFFSMLYWNVDIYLARRVVMMWSLSMYVGQACKNIFKIKRPDSPPAIRLEDNPSLETEYGFPSTHATVNTSIPFSLLYYCVGRYEVRGIH